MALIYWMYARGLMEPIYQLDLRDRQILHAHYMPFLLHGGIFVITDDKLRLKQKVILKISLFDEEMTIAGRVAWMNPPDAQRADKPGYGIRITGENKHKQHVTIRSYLGDLVCELPNMQIY